MYQYFFKRFIDFVISLVGLVLLSPILIMIIILLAIVNKGKPFFFQIRPGLNEKLFKIVKFKTMTDAKDADDNLLPDNQRMTKIGSLVRKTSLDELPQLWSVLKGDMSLIGPRPLLPEYLPLYNDAQKRRHHVKPGITGWAQVNGRNAISWQQKFEYDVWYVNNYSFLTDVKIFLKTFAKVFKSEGINAKGELTTKAFNGN
jgi:undecaprenyl phosphate N,N'-diacetylbacillosamine 1-phosphate transferase